MNILDKRLYDEAGRVKSFLKPIAEQRKYCLHHIAYGVFMNIRKNYPTLQIKIEETPEGFIVRLVA